MAVRKAALSLLLSLTMVASSQGQASAGCREAADIVFVLDVSSSIWERDFKHVRAFVSDVIQELDVGPGRGQMRIAAVTFSSRVQLEFPLHRYRDTGRMVERVKQIRVRGGNTNTHKALQYVDQNIFRSGNGARANVSRVVIVITDGVSRQVKDTRAAAETLRGHGATIFAIGVGKGANRVELEDMASRPVDLHVFEVTRFEGLSLIKSELVSMTCEACVNLPADVLFVLDSSTSIWQHHFYHNVLGFVRGVIKLYDVGRDRTRVGVITYSDDAHEIFGLNSYLYKDELLKAVNQDNIPYTPGSTDTAQALRQAGHQLQQDRRQGAQQIVILVTDGQSMDPVSTMATAKALRQRGVRMLAVGVGDSVDEGELRAVAGNDVVMMVDDFESLGNVSNVLAARSCSAGDAPYTPSPVRPPKPNRCSRLGLADVIFAYDRTTLGSWTAYHLLSTLHHLSISLHTRGADVWVGAVTSAGCPGQSVIPLSGSQLLAKYSRAALRPQLHRVLKTARLSAFRSDNGHRLQARKVMVVVVDEANMSVMQKIGVEAGKLRHEGVQTVALIASAHGHLLYPDVAQPGFGNVIQVPLLDFSDAAYVSDIIARALCGDYQY